MLKQLDAISKAAKQSSEQDEVRQSDRGVYVQVEGRAGEPFLPESFERKSIELLGARELADSKKVRATLFVPADSVDVFPSIVEVYRTKLHSKSNQPFNQPLVESIGEFRIGEFRSLWTDVPDKFPRPGVKFNWEVWLRANSAEGFRSAAKKLGVEIGNGGLRFPESEVLMVFATPEQLEELTLKTHAVSELRRQSVTADFFRSLPNEGQAEWVAELQIRTIFNSDIDKAVRICLLDTGVNRSHPLISPACEDADCNVARESWGTGDDHDGHGTELAGIALYGDLATVLAASDVVEIPHRLESVKIIPPKGENPQALFGEITRDAVHISELMGREVPRVFCLASTTEYDTPHFGQPTSWSSALDQLVAGRGDGSEPRRLMCVSAGNVLGNGAAYRKSDYPTRNDSAEVESPSHAWNCITVGAFTQMASITNSDYRGYVPVAPIGDLCPNSRTSSWGDTWPIKPDVVCEGGNFASEPGPGYASPVDDLSILTTSRDYPTPSFSTTNSTSAATAEAARIVAHLAAENRSLGPVT